jgi:hypothetical protein
MTEKEMADRLRESIDLTRFDEGIYIFNDGGRFGTIKNYQTDSEHYQVMFDNLTREQVLEVFGKEQ